MCHRKGRCTYRKCMVARPHPQDHVPPYACAVCSFVSCCALTQLICRLDSSVFPLSSSLFYTSCIFLVSRPKGCEMANVSSPGVTYALSIKPINPRHMAKDRVTCVGMSRMPFFTAKPMLQAHEAGFLASALNT